MKEECRRPRSARPIVSMNSRNKTTQFFIGNFQEFGHLYTSEWST